MNHLELPAGNMGEDGGSPMSGAVNYPPSNKTDLQNPRSSQNGPIAGARLTATDMGDPPTPPNSETATVVVGIDLSLTSCGIAVITRRTDTSTVATCATVTSRGKRDDGLPQRAQRIAGLAGDVIRHAATAQLVVLEGPSHGSRGGSPLDRHGLWWRVVGELVDRGVPLAVCAPATRAKFATGSGKGDKAAVSSAVSRLWPQLNISNADEADATALAHMGAVALGWDVVTLSRHRESLGAVRWPAGLVPVGEPAA